jgi:hypothetical protein
MTTELGRLLIAKRSATFPRGELSSSQESNLAAAIAERRWARSLAADYREK